MEKAKERLSKEELAKLNITGEEEIELVDETGGFFQFYENWKLRDGRSFFHVHDWQDWTVGWFD